MSQSPSGSNSLPPKNLSIVARPIPSTPIGQTELFIDKQKEIEGVGMGVLSDGTAFLTGSCIALIGCLAEKGPRDRSDIIVAMFFSLFTLIGLGLGITGIVVSDQNKPHTQQGTP